MASHQGFRATFSYANPQGVTETSETVAFAKDMTGGYANAYQRARGICKFYDCRFIGISKLELIEA